MHSITYSTLFGARNHKRYYSTNVAWRTTLATFRDLGWTVAIEGTHATLTHPHDQ